MEFHKPMIFLILDGKTDPGCLCDKNCEWQWWSFMCDKNDAITAQTMVGSWFVQMQSDVYAPIPSLYGIQPPKYWRNGPDLNVKRT